ncbi:MAG: glutamate--tRNA ligase [Thermoproteota archaeon]
MSESKAGIEADAELERLIRAYALLNAVQHGGKAAVNPVLGKLAAEKPEVRPQLRSLVPLVKRIVEEVNKLSLEEQRRELRENFEWLLRKVEEKQRPQEKELPPLPGAAEGRIVTRFAPNPDFVLHLGNARPAVLSYEYARMYKGRMVLRFEDTDPRTKKPMPEAYLMIKEDLRWLGIKWDEEYIQSLRMEIYYDYARKLIEVGGAYVDDRPPADFRRYRDALRLEEYPPRLRSVEENLELWDRMVEGHFGEGEAVLRVKTDPNHPDPSVRDWVAFRIIDTDKHPHPLTGSRYVAWPTYNFAAAVDDHLMGVTHILRAREHVQNTVKQKFIYSYFNWTYPHVVHFGRLKLEDMIMSKSALRSLLEAGSGEGVADPRFATIAGLRRRGIDPEAVRRVVLDVGIKETDASISYANLASINRAIVDPKAKRIMAVFDPIKMIVEDVPWGEREFELPFHPGGHMGSRKIALAGPRVELLVERQDVVSLGKGAVVRLLEGFNVEIISIDPISGIVRARYHSDSLEEARRRSAKIVHWVPAWSKLRVKLAVPEGLYLRYREGIAEHAAAGLRPGEIVQLVRVGFARVDSIDLGEGGEVIGVTMIFAHQ